jgi:hypothetical protein
MGSVTAIRRAIESRPGVAGIVLTVPIAIAVSITFPGRWDRIGIPAGGFLAVVILLLLQPLRLRRLTAIVAASALLFGPMAVLFYFFAP